MSDLMTQLQGSLMMLGNSNVQVYLLKGTAFTLGISLITILISVFIGALLALARNYCTSGPSRLVRRVSIIYIELFRNTPLMLWVFAGFVLCPAPTFSKAFATALGFTSVASVKTLFKAIVSLTLFTSAVMAEIIRGGLNAVPVGQFEAARSQGFGMPRTMSFIVLPQAFRHIVPTLLSQMITTIKDSSYMSGLVTIELMGCTKLLISKANSYNGTWVDRFDRGTIHVTDVFVLFGAAFLIYFIINFSLSCAVRAIKNRKTRPAA